MRRNARAEQNSPKELGRTSGWVRRRKRSFCGYEVARRPSLELLCEGPDDSYVACAGQTPLHHLNLFEIAGQTVVRLSALLSPNGGGRVLTVLVAASIVVHPPIIDHTCSITCQ